MRVLLVASEAVPYAKTGGLADVVGVLPQFLAALGWDVRVVMPRYYGVDRSKLQRVGGALSVPMGISGELGAAVYEGEMEGETAVPIYFVDHEAYFGRASLYNHPDGTGFWDNDNRFVFLSRAALQLCTMLQWYPDVIHCNDWHTAVIPLFLNTLYKDDSLGQAASVLTIHNMEHQGRFYSGLMDVLGVGWEHFNHLELEDHNMVNLLKGGMYHATLINTVSPRYAQEIATPAFGHGLEGVVQDRGADVSGILNGIDYSVWSPETDPWIAAPYTADDRSGKALCKVALQKEVGLPIRADVPLIGLVSRLVHQKGLDLLAECVDDLCRNIDLQFVLLGTGDPWAHALFPEIKRRYPEKFACRIAYSNPLAHRIEAGADLFLMPSRFEPCGLNQLYSLSYGTLPIVHGVGGLADTVENFNEATGEGTGFVFHTFDSQALYNTIGWAVHTFYNRKDALDVMIRRAMRQRFSWETSAARYSALYHEAIERRTGKNLRMFVQPSS